MEIVAGHTSPLATPSAHLAELTGSQGEARRIIFQLSADELQDLNLEAAVDAAAKARLQSATSGNGGNLPLEVCEITAGVSPNG